MKKTKKSDPHNKTETNRKRQNSSYYMLQRLIDIIYALNINVNRVVKQQNY